LLRTTAPSWSLGVFTGFAIAATYLTKLSNGPFILVALVVIIVRFAIVCRKSHTAFVALILLIVCAAIPIGSWIAWLKFHFGDFTGSTAKITSLDWTRKPFAQWWQHPIFTPRGVWIFWSELIGTLWRGEVGWHGKPFQWPMLDRFYAISSLVVLAAAAMGLRKQSGLSAFQRQAICIAMLTFAAGVAFLVFLSIQFDFGSCVNPSRAHPYFTSGRLLSGALIPFILCYVYGVAFLLRRINSAAVPLIVLGAIAAFSISSEIFVLHSVLPSEHNWFHR
jgi:hypothetical protein